MAVGASTLLFWRVHVGSVVCKWRRTKWLRSAINDRSSTLSSVLTGCTHLRKIRSKKPRKHRVPPRRRKDNETKWPNPWQQQQQQQQQQQRQRQQQNHRSAPCGNSVRRLKPSINEQCCSWWCLSMSMEEKRTVGRPENGNIRGRFKVLATATAAAKAKWRGQRKKKEKKVYKYTSI